MQFPQSLNRTQLPLFEAFLNLPSPPTFIEPSSSGWLDEPETFSELTLSGSLERYRRLLAPLLRELSEEQDARWLTLVAPPSALTHGWLRNTGLNLDRLVVLQPRASQSAVDIACEALRLGRSHTVVSWIELSDRQRTQLSNAARTGDTQSLNIKLI
ncbi:SOS-induced cell division inhibitor SulA [Pseudomonas sp. LRF_L74]|uniref:SOS-induced cell division inhibitor SulA n=1 Tax=Pseudomonas sp. LRF_L74 TaxID=3369422 RepID=UPI003F60E4CD